MKLNKRIRTALYDDQRFSGAEMELMHTPAFQRLYDLHQLGLTDRVFIDASHARLHHVLGVVEQAHRLMETLSANLRREPLRDLKYTDEFLTQNTRDFAALVFRRIPAARLMAFLHDLTHAPYGHTLEDEIQLVSEKHDEPSRQADMFYRVVVQFFGWLARNADNGGVNELCRQYPDLASALDAYLQATHMADPPTSPEFITFLAQSAAELIGSADKRQATQPFSALNSGELIELCKNLSFAMRAMLFLEAAHKGALKVEHLPKTQGSYSVEKFFSRLFQELKITLPDEHQFQPHRDAFMLDIIGNTICADLLDYAKRDAKNAGIKLDYDPARISENFTLVSQHQPEATVIGDPGRDGHPFKQHSIRSAISLFSHKLRADMPGELLNLLQVRYYVYERMLYHPTKCIAGAMLGSAIQLIGWKILPPHWRLTGDAVFLREAADAARVAMAFFEKLAREGKVLDDSTVALFEQTISELPPSSVHSAAKQLLSDRRRTVSDAIDVLERVRHLEGKKVAGQALGYFDRIKTQGGSHLTSDHIKSALATVAEPDRNVLESLLTRLLPDISAIRAEITAGLLLLDRLTARQFYKGVFRFLPRATVRGANIEPKHIAEKFLDSKRRYIAEREIETRSGLPIGSIAIHCPKADGPTKLSNILITAGAENARETQPLYNVGQILHPMFEKHEAAIKALQEMYASMWRLSVSVSPRYTGEYQKIIRAAGDVLRELLTEGGNIAVAENDHYMDLELAVSLKRKAAVATGIVTVQRASGAEEILDEEQFDSMLEVEKILRARSRMFGRSIAECIDELLGSKQRTPSSGKPTGRSKIKAEPPMPRIDFSLLAALEIIKPHIVEADWPEVEAYARQQDIEAASDPARMGRLERFLMEKRLQIPDGDQVTKNRAPGKDIIERIKDELGK